MSIRIIPRIQMIDSFHVSVFNLIVFVLFLVLSSLVAVRPPKQALLVRVRTASGTLYAMEHRFFQSCLLCSKEVINEYLFFFFFIMM